MVTLPPCPSLNFAASQGASSHPSLSKLDQLKEMSILVGDTADINLLKTFPVQDCTTNPTLILKASQNPSYHFLIEEAIDWGRRQNVSVVEIADRLLVNFGIELSKIVPGYLSTEIEATRSFDTEGTIEKARALIQEYESRGIPRERVLIKIAATWEGISAARTLEKESIQCNMTLIFSLVQASTCMEAGLTLISPYVGRISDWHTQREGRTYLPEEDPGVRFVRQVYAHSKTKENNKTIVMAASFRNAAQVEALSGCDRLTIPLHLLEELGKDYRPLKRHLVPPTARFPLVGLMEEKDFRYWLNNDAMATEKLAEGIRQFARDYGTLIRLLSQEMEKVQIFPPQN